jgi:predicted amino acid racemase
VRPAPGSPRLEVDLAKVTHNARTLVDLLAPLGIGVTGVTKAVLGSPDVAAAMVAGGVGGLGDSRVENLETLHRAGQQAHVTLVRSPMPSQVERVVASADASCNSEIEVIDLLSDAARRRGERHAVILMVDLGDLREGALAADLPGLARAASRRPGIRVAGIGTNLACRSGVVPDEHNMAELSALADAVEADLGIALDVVSGGNSANLTWALSGAATGRVDDLRLGEAILLGREPLHRSALPGLHTDAFVVVAEVIESKRKPVRPWGTVARAAFDETIAPVDGPVDGADPDGDVHQVLLALGRQDVDPAGLVGPPGSRVVAASSDHLVLTVSGAPPAPGDEVRFHPDYSALVRAATSPFVGVQLSGADLSPAAAPA